MSKLDDLAVLNVMADIFARSSVPLTLADTSREDCPIILANAAFYALTGYGPGEVLERNCRFLQGPETEERSREMIREALRTKSEVTTLITNYKKDGTTFLNHLFLFPMRISDDLRFYLGALFEKDARLIGEFETHLEGHVALFSSLTKRGGGPRGIRANGHKPLVKVDRSPHLVSLALSAVARSSLLQIRYWR